MTISRRSLVLAFIVLAFAAACSGADPRIEGGVAEVEEPLPSLSGVEATVTGGPLPSTAFDGNVTVINVWATWCGPCKLEQPALQAVYERYRNRGVGFVGINYRDDFEKARRWIEDFGVTYPSLFDPDGRTAATMGFPFLPDTYVVDASGTIRYVVYGETTDAELSGLIDDVLEASS